MAKRRQTKKQKAKIMKAGPWRMVLVGSGIKSFRSSKKLLGIVALCRVVNALRFAHTALVQSTDSSTPTGRRQMFGSLLFSGGLVFEGVVLAKRLSRHFRGSVTWKEGLGKLLRHKKWMSFVETNFHNLRNKAVFHIDEGYIASRLEQLGESTYPLMSGIKTTAGETYYDLGDMVALQALVGDCETQEEWEAKLRDAIVTARDVTLAFLDSAEDLIAESLSQKDYLVEPVDLASQ